MDGLLAAASKASEAATKAAAQASSQAVAATRGTMDGAQLLTALAAPARWHLHGHNDSSRHWLLEPAPAATQLWAPAN
jgi:hypothetical protein